MASIASLRSLFARPQIAGRVAAHGLATLGTSTFLPATSSVFQLLPPVACQSRYMGMTKTKRRQRGKMIERENRVARGLPAKPNPPKYIPRDLPVIGAMTREERDDEARRSDAAAAEEMKVKIAKQVEAEENLRFQFEGLEMSDRVRKLFALRNGSQREVVWSQKRRGMEVSENNCHNICHAFHYFRYMLNNGFPPSAPRDLFYDHAVLQALSTERGRHGKFCGASRGIDDQNSTAADAHG